MTIANGQSEIDTVVLRLADTGGEIRNWSTYQFNQRFLTPTSSWTFTVSDEDTTLTNELLVPGARVELSINDRLQCTGTIDKKTVASDKDRGTKVSVHGRDILGRVVNSTMDPIFKFTTGLTIVDAVLSVLRPFGIDTLYNSDAYNINIITGYQKGKHGGGQSKVKVQVPKRTVSADGTVKLTYDTVDGFVTIDPTRPDLKKLQLQQAKPHVGEGVYAYLDRLLRRLGLAMWAAADGSGVVIGVPDFTGPAIHKLIHRRGDTSENNVTYGQLTTDLSTQPSCIMAYGFGGGVDVQKSALKVLMVNELTGLDDAGNPLPEILNIKARYKSCKVLPIRADLVPFTRPIGDQHLSAPLFCEDKESKNLAQLEAYVRREMANKQQGALSVNYEVIGHTQGGYPWAVNTLVSVDDEVLGIHRDMWVAEKTFTKDSGGGTKTSLRLILPHTLQISE
jgi:prophage tail gpP-like protein